MPYMINQWACNITSFHLYVSGEKLEKGGPSYCALVVEERAAIGIACRDDDVCK